MQGVGDLCQTVRERDACVPGGVSEEIRGAAWRPHPLESRRGRLRTRIYNLRITIYNLRTYDLLLFFSVADDLFVGMLVKGSFTVKYGRGVYILHYEEHIAPYLKVHEIT